MPLCDLLHARRNKRSTRRLCLTSQSRDGRTLYETYRPDWRSTDCFAGNDRIRLRQAGHGALARGGQHPDPGQGRPRAWPRPYGPRRARSPLRMGQRPWSSLRMVQGTRSPPSPISIRWIRLRHPIARAIRELQRRERVAPTRRGRFSPPECRWVRMPIGVSRAPSRPRFGSGPNDFWRRASA
jgi:hypothetical protein